MITHWHDDHPQGISAIRDAYPKVRIISTPQTEAGMLGPEAFDVGYSPGPKLDAALPICSPSRGGATEKLLADPATAPDRKERIKKALGQYDMMANDFKGTLHRPADGDVRAAS